MLKEALTAILSVSMLLSSATTVFAADLRSPDQKAGEVMTVDDVIEQLNAIDFGMNITFTALPQSRASTGQECLEFDSVQDAEMYLKDITKPGGVANSAGASFDETLTSPTITMEVE